MSAKSVINQTTCIIDSLLCQQRQAWTRARRVNRSGGALTAPGGTGRRQTSNRLLLMLVACYSRSYRATSNADAIPNHLLTSLKYHWNCTGNTTDADKENAEKLNFIAKNNCPNPFLFRFTKFYVLPEEIFVIRLRVFPNGGELVAIMKISANKINGEKRESKIDIPSRRICLHR